MCRSTAMFVAYLLPLLASPNPVRADGDTPPIDAAAAEATVERYASSWSKFSLDEYEPLLHANFEFTPVPSKGGEESSWDRATELTIARDLFEGGEAGGPRMSLWDVSYAIRSTRESWESPGAIEVLCDFSIDVERDGSAWTSTNRSFLLLVPDSDGEFQILRWTEIESS